MSPIAPGVLGRLFTSLKNYSTIVIALACIMSCGAPASAQSDPIFDAAGFQQNRDYFSQAPFENIDTLSGSLVLTFTDLVLPGNAGRDLRFQRTYNSKLGGWNFGLAGWVMQVHDSPGPDPTSQNRDSFLPHLITADGADHQTGWISGTDTQWVITAQFWKYDRTNRALYLPDGTRCYYDTSGRLVEIIDPFAGGATLDWSAPGLHVVQSLGNGQTRNVVIGVTVGGWSSLTFGGRTWTYEWVNDPGFPVLNRVIPPAGPAWVYSYDGSLTQVTTPYGGQTSYTYGIHQFGHEQDPANQSFTNSLVVLTKSVGGRGIAAGTWTFDYTGGTQGDPCAAVECTTITAPSGTRTVYVHGPVNALPYSPSLGGDVPFTTRTVIDTQGRTVEQETREYIGIPVVNGPLGGTPELARQTIVRDGATYVTEHHYASTNFGDYHRPFQTIETGPGLSPTTTRTFDYGFQTYITGKIASEQVTVNGESTLRAWTYDHATGFTSSQNDHGITTLFERDGVGNVYRATDANGHATTFGYQWGVVSGIWKPETAIVRTINPEGTVASETRGSRTTAFSYDPLFRIAQTQPPGTNAIVTSYDDANGTITVIRGASQTVTTVDGFGRPVQTSNAVGVRTHNDYDAEGRKTYESYPFTATDVGTHTDYDALGRVVRKTNQDGTFASFTYGPGTTAIHDQAGRTTTQTWQAFGDPGEARLASVADANGQTWSYSYNALGALTQVAGPAGPNGEAIGRTWHYRAGTTLLDSETQPESGTTTYGYDSAGNLTSKTDANGTGFTFSYDGNNRLTRVLAGGRQTTITYEPGSDNRQTASGPSVMSTFVYDGPGRLQHRNDVIDGRTLGADFGYDGNDSLTDITYTSGRRVHQEYDAENRLIHVVDSTTGVEYARSFAYHPSGALQSYQSANGITHSMSYDVNRYWLRTIDAGELHLSYDNYDGVGNVRGIADSRAGMGQQFGYDALDRLASASGPYGSITFAYDAHGNRIDAGGAYQYQSGTMRLVGQSGAAYGYDQNGNLRTGPNTSYTYTPDNLLETASLPGGASASYAYDADNWRTKKVSGSVTSYFSRGAAGELLTEWADPNGALPSIKDYIYAGGRLLAEAERRSPLGGVPPLPALPGAPATPGAPGPVVSPGLTPPAGPPPPPPPIDPPPPSGPQGVFYDTGGYGGASFTAGDMAYVGDTWNDRITSVHVPANTRSSSTKIPTSKAAASYSRAMRPICSSIRGPDRTAAGTTS
jgi:YD repeat-containing protein